jgi:hypothetical protein
MLFHLIWSMLYLILASAEGQNALQAHWCIAVFFISFPIKLLFCLTWFIVLSAGVPKRQWEEGIASVPLCLDALSIWEAWCLAQLAGLVTEADSSVSDVIKGE